MRTRYLFCVNIVFLFVLNFSSLCNYGFHEYAALEIDMLTAKDMWDEPVTEEERVIIGFIHDFKTDAKKLGQEFDFSRISYKILPRLGHDQAFINRNITVLGSCNRVRKHMQFLRGEIQPYNYANVKQTVYHELGHCLLNLDHSHDNFNNSVPSIMVDFKHFDWTLWNQYNPTHWDLAVTNLIKHKQ